MSRFLAGLVAGLAVGLVVGSLAGGQYNRQRCSAAAFEEQVSRHGCRLSDVELNGSVVVNVTCELPDGTILRGAGRGGCARSQVRCREDDPLRKKS